MKYTVLSCHSFHPGNLIQEVEEYLEKGWKLQGGVSVSRDGQDVIYAQALIKEEDPTFTDEYYDNNDE